MSVSVSVRNVRFEYGKIAVLRDVHLSLMPGEIVGLIGPNGVGKTTLARLITGFLHPTAGSVNVADIPAVEYRRNEGIGYAPEELPRPWDCKVGELLRLRGESAGAEQVCAVLDVDRLRAKTIPQLSKGQWRTVLTAFATMSLPRLVVLDEPDSGLDPGALDRLAELLRLCGTHGITVLLLSHQLAEIERTCKRVVFVRDGQIAADHQIEAGVALRERYRQVFS